MTETVIGIISDTHGLLRPEAIEALRDCSQIIHAGDVGRAEVLDALRSIAPTTTVRGNVDRGDWAQSLPLTETVSINGVSIHVLHDLHTLNIHPVAAGVRVVISGHSHQPSIDERSGVLYINPGAAGPRRFRSPVTLCRLVVDHAGGVETTMIDLLA